MLCKWCGMESVTTDQCSWCHRALSTTTEGSSTAPAPATAATRSRPPVSLRRASAPLAGGDSHAEMDDSPLNQGSDTIIAPTRSAKVPAPPAPPPSARPAANADANKPALPIIGLKRGGAKGGTHIPAPSMPPVRASGKSSLPSAAPVPLQRHVPAPAILPGSMQNRAGGVMPKSPHVPAPLMAPVPTKAGAKTAAAPSRAAALADAAPEAEAGGLADGVSAPRVTPAQAAAEMHVPAMGTFTPAQSKYYPGQVIDPTSGTHYDADSGKPTLTPTVTQKPKSKKQAAEGDVELHWDSPVSDYMALLTRFLLAFAGILAVAGLLVHAYPAYYVLPLLAALFFAGLLMPIMGVVPKQRDDSDDVWIFAGLMLIFGPAIGLVIYGVIGILRQSVNHAIMGCFVVSVLTQLVIYFTAGQTHLLFGPPWVQVSGFDLRTLFINWAGFVAMAGWFSANMFHKFDE